MSRRPPADRRYDAQAILQIKAAKTSNAAEAKIRCCSKEFIRQVRAGLVYKDLWDPALAIGSVSCLRCVHRGSPCDLEIPEAKTEGPDYAKECLYWKEMTK